jgi:Protein of unknown function (DUF559)
MLRTVPVDLEGFAALVETRRRWLGAHQAARVLPLTDARAMSPGESRLRMVWQLHAGLPRPLSNVTVLGRDGEFLAMVDLLDLATGLVAEYDGAHHANAEQRAADHAREERLERAGLVVVRATAVDLTRRLLEIGQRLRSGHEFARQRSSGRRRAWSISPPVP